MSDCKYHLNSYFILGNEFDKISIAGNICVKVPLKKTNS